MKAFFKKKFNFHNFDISIKNNEFVFKLNGQLPLSKTFLVVKNHTNQQRITKKIINSQSTISLSEIADFGLGLYDIYLKTKIFNKIFLLRTNFKNSNENKFIIDSDNHLKLQSQNFNGKLSFELKKYCEVDDNDVNIFKVQDEDISDLIFDKKEYEYKVSAIVLVYNGEPYLRECLNSLVNQTLDDLEIILMNDKSTDDSLEICKEFGLKYDNIKIIDKQTNHGLATSANMGIQIARGEYVILVDNDDIIPPDAYEKLYNKAKSNDADISIGQANLLYDDRQDEMYNTERKVYEEEKVINNFSEFPELFNDAFYWNKIIKKSLIIENNIELPKGMIYADRKFAHTAFIYAKTISIIPDCVYIWRIRLEDKNHISLSRKRSEAGNYINRIDSYEQDLDKLTNAYPQYFKILMRRVIIPIKGILDSKEFEDAFYKRGVKLLKQECVKLDNIYDNQFDNWDNILIYLALNDYKSEIKDLLELDLTKQRDLIKKDNEIYWNLPLFGDNLIPDDLFKVKSMIPQFLSIDKIISTDDEIIFKNIKIPDNLDVINCEVNLIGKTNYDGVLADNIISYEVINGDVKIQTSDLADFEIYDVFFKSYYSNRPSDNFRIQKHCIGEFIGNSSKITFAITKYGNFSIIPQRLNNILGISIDDNALKIKLNSDKLIKQKLNIFLQNDVSHEKAYFSLTDDNEYILKWKYFYDEGSNYSFKISLFNEKLSKSDFNLNQNYLFDDIELKTNNVSVIKDKNNNYKLTSN